MTFEARDSAAKVVPARLKLSTTGPPTGSCAHNVAIRNGHGSLRTAGSQTAANVSTATHHGLHGSLHGNHHHHHHTSDRHSLTQSFVQFSRALALDSTNISLHKNVQGTSPSGTRSSSLKVPQGSINRSPSAPDLVLNKPSLSSSKETLPTLTNQHMVHKSPITGRQSSRRTFAACALLNPSLLPRQALSVDETGANYSEFRSNESLHHGTGSQGSMAMDLHLEAVTLKIRDKRRNPLKRQRKVEEEELKHDISGSIRNSHSHSCSPRLSGQHLRDITTNGGSTQYLPSHAMPHHSCHRSSRRSSNSSDCTHRSRSRRRESNSCHHTRRHLERAISSDSRLTGAIPKCYHSHEPSRNNSTEHESQDQKGTSTSENDIRRSHQVMVHFSPNTEG